MSEVLHSFHVVLTEPAPPSVNHLYTNGYGGKRVLSREGQAFKSALTQAVVSACAEQTPWLRAIDAVYNESAWVRLTIGLHTALYNASWKPGGLTKSGARQSPYKTLDGPNYLKAIEDAIKDGTGIDDAAHLSVTIEKLDAPGRWVEVAYEVLSARRRHG